MKPARDKLRECPLSVSGSPTHSLTLSLMSESGTHRPTKTHNHAMLFEVPAGP